MIARTVVAALACAVAVAGTASAATLVVNTEPILASIVVEIPPCGEESSGAGISISWSPDRACAVPADGDSTTGSALTSTPENTQSGDVPGAAEANDPGPSQADATTPDYADTVVEPEAQLPPEPETGSPDEPETGSHDEPAAPAEASSDE